MSGLRSLVWRALAEADVLLSDQRQERLQREAFLAGWNLLHRVSSCDGENGEHARVTRARSLGLAEPVLPRLLGFGWQQAQGLAELAQTPRTIRPEVARLGGLLNLGIALFDHICDRLPERAELLSALVTPDFLDSHLQGRAGIPPPSHDTGVDFLVGLIGEFFRRALALGGDAEDRQAFNHLIHSMYFAERFATRARRDDGPPTLGVWRALRHKSALPIEAMALLTLLPHPNADDEQRRVVRAAARLAGDAIWIVDDLTDVREDWEAACWSRPVWLLARMTDCSPLDAEDAIRKLLNSGIAVAESHRLADRLVRLRALVGAPGRALVHSIQAAVQAWTSALPD